jgi:hypothetical protein
MEKARITLRSQSEKTLIVTECTNYPKLLDIISDLLEKEDRILKQITISLK